MDTQPRATIYAVTTFGRRSPPTSATSHCLSTQGGEKVPRPFGPAVHGTAPNDLVQFDYIEIGPSNTGEKYVLMVRDDHSDYKWFFPFANTNAENAAIAIIDWCAAFTVPKSLMSCLLYTSPSPRDQRGSRMPSSA